MADKQKKKKINLKKIALKKIKFNWKVLPMYLIFIVLSLMGKWWIPLLYFIIIGGYVLLRYIRSNLLYNIMNSHSVLIAGAKGTGKDLLTQGYVYSKKPYYYSNISYGYKFHPFEFKDVDLSPNTYHNFINGNIDKVKDYNIKEGSKIIISDGGIYLPSQYDSELSKKYRSLPIYFALSRHLSETDIILNTQAYSRVWVKLREQFDNYILTKKTTSKFMQKIMSVLPILNHFIFVECYYYEQVESFERKLRPFTNTGLFSKNNPIYSTTADTLKKTYDFENGKIIRFVVPIWKSKIKYDTRIFKKILLD